MTATLRAARRPSARPHHRPAQFSLVPPADGVHFGEIEVDSFAGGGGASEGIRLALGRGPAVGINHDAEAIALHAANHPETRHYCESVWQVDPYEVCDGRPVGLMWLSPDCKHFSKAKGARPVSKRVRGLAWVACRWAKAVRPRVIILENVEEFQTWGPVLPDGMPCPARKGQTFRRFVGRLRRLGYEVEWRELRACDYGAPTIRKRLFLIARCDGEPITWPAPTHGPGRALPWRTAAECIDWSLPCPSIFLTREEGRAVGAKRPLADKTLRRIAAGLRRFVFDNPRPFVVRYRGDAEGSAVDIEQPMPTVTANGYLKRPGGAAPLAVVAPSLVHTAHGDEGATSKRWGHGSRSLEQPTSTSTASNDLALVAPVLSVLTHGGRSESIGEPLRTTTTAQRGERAMIAPVLVPRYGERDGQAPRARPVDLPAPVIVPTANGASLAAAFLAKHYGDTGQRPGSALAEPVSTVTASDHNALVTSHLVKFNHAEAGQPVDAPAHTVMAQGEKLGLVRAFLTAYYGAEAEGAALDAPARTVTARDRLGLVTVAGAEYQIADIGMRMLAPRELYRAQGFRDSYRIDVEFNGKPLSKTAQVRMCGNSVCPDVAAALVRANYGAARDAEPDRRVA